MTQIQNGEEKTSDAGEENRNVAYKIQRLSLPALLIAYNSCKNSVYHSEYCILKISLRRAKINPRHSKINSPTVKLDALTF